MIEVWDCSFSPTPC